MAARKESIEGLISTYYAAEAHLDAARVAMNEVVQEMDVGTIIVVDKVPHEIVPDDKHEGRKKVKTVFTKRQMALVRGEIPPPRVARKRRSRSAANDSAEEPAES